MNVHPSPLAVALVVLVLIAAVCDIRTRSIPNPVTICGAAVGLLLNISLSGWAGAKASLLGLALGFAIFLPLFLVRGMGGGDVKLMAAIGAIAGPSNTFIIFILTAITGGVLAVALVLWRGALSGTFRNLGFIVTQLMQGKPPHQDRPDLTIDHPHSLKLPYAVPIALGSLLSLLL
jgi:prepilin peptidase CpaA